MRRENTKEISTNKLVEKNENNKRENYRKNLKNDKK